MEQMFLLKGRDFMYLTRTKASGSTYYYLAEYKRREEHTTRKEVYVFSFGRFDKALKKIETWIKYPMVFPEELIELGFKANDALGWKKKILEYEESFSNSCTHDNKKVI